MRQCEFVVDVFIGVSPGCSSAAFRACPERGEGSADTGLLAAAASIAAENALRALRVQTAIHFVVDHHHRRKAATAQARYRFERKQSVRRRFAVLNLERLVNRAADLFGAVHVAGCAVTGLDHVFTDRLETKPFVERRHAVDARQRNPRPLGDLLQHLRAGGIPSVAEPPARAESHRKNRLLEIDGGFRPPERDLQAGAWPPTVDMKPYRPPSARLPSSQGTLTP